MKSLRKLILAGLMLAMPASAAFGEMSCEEQDKITEGLTMTIAKIKAMPDCEYETNEGYCESVYWEDELNCVGEYRVVTREFCESIVFEDTRAVCFAALKEQGKITADDCEIIGYENQRKMCFRALKEQK